MGGWPALACLTKKRVPHSLGVARDRLFAESAVLFFALGTKGGLAMLSRPSALESLKRGLVRSPDLHPTAPTPGASGTPDLHPTAPTPGASGPPELWRWSDDQLP